MATASSLSITPVNGVLDGLNPDGNPVADALTTMRLHVFGHSLFIHEGSSPYTRAGEWMALAAQSVGATFGGSFNFGQWLWNGSASDIPPVEATGEFPLHNDFNPWGSGAFADADLSHVMIMQSNYGDHLYEPAANVAQYAVATIDAILALHPDVQIVLYEHWPDAGNWFPNDFSSFHARMLGGHHAWHVEYQNAIIAARPELDFKMVPVGPILSDLQLNESYLQGVSFDTWYEDSAPHGTDNIYSLAAFICFRALYNRNLDVGNLEIPPAASLIPEITNNLQAIVDYIDARLMHYNNNGVQVY